MRILIVDDNANMRRAMRRLLESDDTKVWVAESGPQACQVIGYGYFDVVVTDYEMPGMNGDDCWELDALEPKVLVGLLRDVVDRLLDTDLWVAATDREEQMRAELRERIER
jgi:DNA-binding NtrC family response regulator